MSNDATNPHDNDDDLDIDPIALGDLASILSDASVWEESDPSDEAAIMAAIDELIAADSVTDSVTAVDDAPQRNLTSVSSIDAPAPSGPIQSVPTQPASITPEPSNVVPISRAKRWVTPFAAGLAAALALVVGFGALTADTERETVELALAATDLAPGADGVVEIAETPNGTVLLLDVSGLPPAPEGSYYEAWVRQDAEVGVSAGTFHLRGGGGEIELWAGVSTDEYPLFTITIQDEADPVSSGQVVLRGLLEG